MKTDSLFSSARVSMMLALAVLPYQLLHATPFATCMTNNGDGTVSFRLNQTTGTNDLVAIIVGSTTNFLQLPSANPANVVNRGLITTNISISAGANFHVRIKHTGSGVISSNGPSIAFNAPRGISVNNRPGSPYFGWVYVANASTAAGGQGAGMYAYSADLADVLNQGHNDTTNVLTGGYPFLGTAGTHFSPYHTSVAPDDSVLVTDWTETQGNLIAMTPTISSFTYVLGQFNTNGLPAGVDNPVGTNNNHGSVISAFIVGSGASRKLYEMDEDYQTDPTQSSSTEINSAWEYDIGATSVPWSNAPNRKLMTPFLAAFTGQNEKCEVYGHYLYTNQRRSNPPQHSTYITDLNNLLDPSTYDPGNTPWDTIWASQTESLAEGYSDDVLRDTMTTSVSPDQKWYATIIAAGSNPTVPIVAPDGTTFTTMANDINLIPLTNGIPNLPARQVFTFTNSLGNGRDVTLDAVHNIYMVSSGMAILQALDIGESTDVTTGTDGIFSFATPATQASIAATTPLALEQGTVPGVFTITRTPEDIGNPVTVFYSVSGTAKAGVNYVALPGSVVIPANQTTATVQVTPIADATPNPTLTVVLSIKGSGGYSVGFPNSATAYIVDNSQPQVLVTGLSTNIFEGNPRDYAALSVTRYGDTNTTVVLDTTNFAFGGTATLNVDYYLTNLPIVMGPGVVSSNFPLIAPLQASSAVGTLSILLTNKPGSNFTVASNTAATTITLSAYQPGTLQFSDDFESDPTGSNWKLAFQSYTNGSQDYTVNYDYDYANGPAIGNLVLIPPAPHSGPGGTHGLYMTVNKNAGVSAGLNLYLKSHTFSGNYAVRFDLFLVQNSSSTLQSQNENVLFGMNHDGSHTNWFRNAVPGTSPEASPTPSDGLFFDVGADGQGGGGAIYDYGAWTGPTYTNGVKIVGPTNIIFVQASSLTGVFKKPPFDSGGPKGGDCANQVVAPGSFTSPEWVQVEISQRATALGNHIIYKINNTPIMDYYNTNGVAATANSGTIMLGYCDPWDDIANGSPGQGEGSAIIDNLTVVGLPAVAALTITSEAVSGTNFVLTFNSVSPASYVTQFKSNVTDLTWIGVANSIGNGSIVTVTTPITNHSGFYRVVQVE